MKRFHATRAGLVVMTTHGLGPVGRFLLGSVADDLIRRGPAPVLLVPPHDPAPGLIPEPDLNRILIPLDGSGLSEGAVVPALDLARTLGATCTLLRVLEGNDDSSAEGREAAETYLHKVAEAGPTGLRVDIRVVQARHAAEAILEEAARQPGTLVAMATHGRGGWSRLLMGSVADKVAQAAAAPVLVMAPQSE